MKGNGRIEAHGSPRRDTYTGDYHQGDEGISDERGDYNASDIEIVSCPISGI